MMAGIRDTPLLAGVWTDVVIQKGNSWPICIFWDRASPLLGTYPPKILTQLRNR